MAAAGGTHVKLWAVREVATRSVLVLPVLVALAGVSQTADTAEAAMSISVVWYCLGCVAST